MRRGFTLVELLVVVAIVVILVAILFPTFKRAPDDGRGLACQTNLSQIGLAYLLYLRDYDDHLPLISNGDRGWAISVELYGNGFDPFHCPSSIKATGAFSSDYFYNSRVAGLKRSQISFGARTILFGDSLTNGATNSHFSELPLNWRIDENSPAKRHLDGANYAFVDGHVKWLRPEKVTIDAPKNGNATFAVR